MLANRKIRADVSRTKLEKTVKTLQDEQMMHKLRSLTLEETSQITSYREGWDETYLDNFMLNRYGNMRISDETIFYADKIGWSNRKMQDKFLLRAITVYPLPVLNYVGYKAK